MTNVDNRRLDDPFPLAFDDDFDDLDDVIEEDDDFYDEDGDADDEDEEDEDDDDEPETWQVQALDQSR